MDIKVYYDGKEFTQAEYNTYILYKYLTKHYDKNIARKVIENSKDLNIVAKALGKEDIAFFCLYYLRDSFVAQSNNTNRNLAPVHLDVWEELNKMIVNDEYDKEEFILPRGCSKSTIINKALSCYAHCYKISRYTIVIGNKESDAIQFISDTRKMLENKYIEDSFGRLINKKERTLNKQEIELTNNTKIQAFSWGSSVRGTTYGCPDGIFRPSLVILDDIISEKDILTEEAKEKVMKKYNTEVSEVGDEAVYRNGEKIKKATKFIVIGTPLAPDDMINTIRQDSTFKVFHRKVVNFDIDEYFENNEYWQLYKKILQNDKISKDEKEKMLNDYYIDNIDKMKFKTIWEKYRCNKLAERYFTQRTAFMQELMCDTENIGEKWFKSIRTMTPEEIEKYDYSKTMLAVDPASTTKATSDYSAFCVGSESSNDFVYIRKGIIEKLTFNEYCNRVIELLKEYEDITHIYIEKNLYQGSDVIKIKELMLKDKELIDRDITCINEMQRKNKDDKISSIVDDVNFGRIIFNEEDEEFIKQIKEFSGQAYSLHDDAPDVVAECVNRLKTIEEYGELQIYDIRKLGL